MSKMMEVGKAGPAPKVTKVVPGTHQLKVRDISITPGIAPPPPIGPEAQEASTYLAPSMSTAIQAIQEQQAGARVVYIPMTPTIHEVVNKTRIEPAGNALHMLKEENRQRVTALTTAFNEFVRQRQWQQADQWLEQMSKFAPGLSKRDMINHYTNPIHHAVMAHPEIHALFVELYGQDYRYLHNRMCFRCREGDLEVSDASLHKEGDPGELGYIVCLPGERSFCFMPNEHMQPLAPPGTKRFRPIQLDTELTNPVAHEVVSLRVHIPDGYLAVILFDHYKPHGIDPRGMGLQLYLSACHPDKLRHLDTLRSKMLKPTKSKPNGTWYQAHDPRMRDPDMDYQDTVKVALLSGVCDQFWPSGKPIPAHLAHQQSVKHNLPKLRPNPNQDGLWYELPERGEEPSLRKRQRMQAAGFQLPELAWELPWVIDPEEMPEAALYRWGFKRHKS